MPGLGPGLPQECLQPSTWSMPKLPLNNAERCAAASPFYSLPVCLALTPPACLMRTPGDCSPGHCLIPPFSTRLSQSPKDTTFLRGAIPAPGTVVFLIWSKTPWQIEGALSCP